MKLVSRGKPRFQLSSARSAGQPIFSGRKVCLNSGRCGSVKIAAIEERSYWKMATLRLSFKKNGKSGVRADWFARGLRKLLSFCQVLEVEWFDNESRFEVCVESLVFNYEVCQF